MTHAGESTTDIAGGQSMAAETGKRYRCAKCGAEFIVTRGGDATLRCDGDELEQL